MKTVFFALILTSFALPGAETPNELRDRGLEALRAAQSDESKLVEAARVLAQAAGAYERAGNEPAAVELNSYLYWCKKRLTLAQSEVLAGKGDSGRRAASRMAAVADRKIEASEAEKWLQRAESFAQAHQKEHLLCAIRYFEVADRFTGSQESLVAQRKSLELMGKVKAVAVKAPVSREPLESQRVFEFGRWTLAVPEKVANVVDARTGRWWYMFNGAPCLKIQKIPPYLQRSKLIQQRSGHAWISQIKTNHPVIVYAAIRLRIKRSSGAEVFMTEQQFAGHAQKSGWRITNGLFRGDSVNETWTWGLIGKVFPAGALRIDNPFLGTQNVCAVFFIQPK